MVSDRVNSKRWKAAAQWTLGVLLVAPYVAGGTYLSYKFWIERPVLTLSSGSKGGLYYEIGEKLPEILQRALDDTIRFESKPSDGSTQNVDRIERGEAQLALAQDGLEAGPAVRALARLYTSPLHVVVPKDAHMKGVPDLVPRDGKKQRAFIGREKSGTRVVTELVLKQYGLVLSDLEIKGSNDWDINGAAAALKNGDIDVAFFLVGVGAEALNGLAADGRFTLLNVDRADGIATTFPYLEKVEVPRGAYPSKEDFPHSPVSTVASHELLICSRDMNTRTAYRIVEAVFTHAPELTRTFPLLTQLSQIDPNRNFYYPLHYGAESYYRRLNLPSVIPWPIVGVSGTYTLTTGAALLLWYRRRRVRHLVSALMAIDDAIRASGEAMSATEWSSHRKAIQDIEREAIRLYSAGKIKADPYDSVKEYARICWHALQRSTPPGEAPTIARFSA